jgi:hypothetical protein
MSKRGDYREAVAGMVCRANLWLEERVASEESLGSAMVEAYAE